MMYLVPTTELFTNKIHQHTVATVFLFETIYITYITWTLNNKLFFDHLRSVQMISPNMWTRCSDDLRCLVPALCTFVAIRGSKMMKFSQLQQIFLDPVSDPALIWWSPWGRRRSLAAFLDRDDDAPLSSSFHNYTSHPTQGYWAVPNEKCLVHRSLLRELYGPAIGPEHYCVNQNAQRDFKASKGFEPTQKCYDLQNCQAANSGHSSHGKGRPQRPVLSTDPDYPNTVVFLTPEAADAALGMK